MIEQAGSPSGISPSAPERDFDDLVYDSIVTALKHILGDSGSTATIYHLKLKKDKFYPDLFHENLTGIFHAGAESIEKVILTELFRSLNSESKIREGYDFQRNIGLALKIHASLR